MSIENTPQTIPEIWNSRLGKDFYAKRPTGVTTIDTRIFWPHLSDAEQDFIADFAARVITSPLAQEYADEIRGLLWQLQEGLGADVSTRLEQAIKLEAVDMPEELFEVLLTIASSGVFTTNTLEHLQRNGVKASAYFDTAAVFSEESPEWIPAEVSDLRLGSHYRIETGQGSFEHIITSNVLKSNGFVDELATAGILHGLGRIHFSDVTLETYSDLKMYQKHTAETSPEPEQHPVIVDTFGRPWAWDAGMSTYWLVTDNPGEAEDLSPEDFNQEHPGWTAVSLPVLGFQS